MGVAGTCNVAGTTVLFFKTLLQTFGAAAVVVLIAPHLCITFVTATGQRGRVHGWRQELNFQTQKDRMKPLS